ncbi:MAG: histidine phosphatase family protein [Isosphaeraceae bacterium]
MLWLVRHGESLANAGGVPTTDYAAIPLTDRGRAQAEAVAAACREAPAWIGRSPYLRALQTAAPLLARYPESPALDLPIHEFTYLAESRVAMDAVARQPMVDAYWARMDPDHRDGDGAETFADLHGRARAFLREAAGRAGFGVVFTHEQFIRAVLVAAMYPGEAPSVGLMRRFFALRGGMPIPNAAVVRMRWDAGRWWSGGVDVSHLRAAEPGEPAP